MPELPLADSRGAIAHYVVALTWVYTLLILVAVVISMYQAFGGRIPYNRPLRALLGFVEQVTDPVLRLFRRIVPMIGPLDLSPMVAVIAIGVAGNLVARLIVGL